MNRSEALKLKWKDPEFREQMIAGQRKHWADPGARERHSQSIKLAHNQIGIRCTKSIAMQAVWKRKGYKRRCSRAISRAIRLQFATNRFPAGGCVTIDTVKSGKIVCHKRSTEQIVAKMLDDLGAVENFEKDTVRIPYKWNGKHRTYFPDFYVVLTNGVVLLLEIKKNVTTPCERDRLKFAAARRYCEDSPNKYWPPLCWVFLIVEIRHERDVKDFRKVLIKCSTTRDT